MGIRWNFVHVFLAMRDRIRLKIHDEDDKMIAVRAKGSRVAVAGSVSEALRIVRTNVMQQQEIQMCRTGFQSR